MSTERDTIADPAVAIAIRELADAVELLNIRTSHLDAQKLEFITDIMIQDKLRTVRAQLRGGETSVGSA